MIGLVLIFIYLRFTVDDAFISWRYALTLVHHGHWKYSAGVPRVEGYTDFLYTALAVVPALLHIPIELFFKVIALMILATYVVTSAEWRSTGCRSWRWSRWFCATRRS